jgi:adenylate cyclase
MAFSPLIPQATLHISGQPEGDDSTWVLTADNTSIGRGQGNDIILPYSWISRRHSMLQADERNTYTIIDVGSANGTLVNDKLIHTPTELSSGDTVSMGNTTLTFIQEEENIFPLRNNDEHLEDTVVFLQKKAVSILVCDIRGYTALSEQLGADQIGRLLQLWCKAVSKVVTDNGGQVDKFIGDAVMAVWSDGDGSTQVIRALIAADEMQRLTEELGSRFSEIKHPLRLWTALNSGEAVLGNIGVTSNRDYTIVGDTVNVAFRLEDQTSRLNSDVVIGEASYHHLPALQSPFRLHIVDIRGKSEPFKCYGCNSDELRRFVSNWQKRTDRLD